MATDVGFSALTTPRDYDKVKRDLKAAGYNKPDCLLSKVGGTYQPISTAELVDRVRRLSKALRDLGVEKGDRVALMSENGPHWPTVDFATLCAGAVLVPIYPTLLPDQSTYIARNCGAKAIKRGPGEPPDAAVLTCFGRLLPASRPGR